MCQPLHEVSGGVDDLHCCATHSRGVLKRNMLTPTSEAAFGKGGILHLGFRRTGRHFAALTLEQMCRLFYLKRSHDKSDVTDSTLWEDFKAVMRGHIIAYEAKLKKDREREMSEIVAQLSAHLQNYCLTLCAE